MTNDTKKQRLDKAVESFVKGVRNELLFFEQLTKSFEKGGIGLNNEEADKIIKKLRPFIQKNHNSPSSEKTKEIIDEPQDLELDVKDNVTHQRHSFYEPHTKIDNIKDFAKHIQEHSDVIQKFPDMAPPTPSTELRPEILPEKVNAHASTLTQPAISKELKAVDKDTRIKSDDFGSIKKKKVVDTSPKIPKQLSDLIDNHAAGQIIKTPKQVIPQKTSQQIPQSQGLSSNRPRLDDVTYKPKMFTPVDEMRSLRIEDFRRLSSNPKIAIEKIMTKIEVLQQDSFVKQAQGIKALKESQLYKEYADIMNTSLLEGRPFQSVIEEKNVLTLEEFQALMELNKKLAA